jgi:hypothetical protein
MDASNLLKPMLARGELRCIGATTLDEYRQYIEKDPALERRFQQVYVDQPSVTDTISILRGLRERYELHHGVKISDSALVEAAVLSDRYIADRFLPGEDLGLRLGLGPGLGALALWAHASALRGGGGIVSVRCPWWDGRAFVGAAARSFPFAAARRPPPLPTHTHIPTHTQTHTPLLHVGHKGPQCAPLLLPCLQTRPLTWWTRRRPS